MRSIRNVLFVVALSAALLLAVPGLATAATELPCDFNGDGRADAAAGVPNEAVGGDQGAGAVQVLTGTNNGLRPFGNDLLHQGDNGVNGATEPFDSFGAAVACGDFDNDGLGDLAVGVPNEEVGGTRGGAVQVFYGSADGLSAQDDLWHQDDDGIAGAVEEDDQFGGAVAAGDFDGDGHADLAVGIPGEDVAGENGAGAAQILYGSARGLTARDELWHQNDRAIVANAGERDFFGDALTAGDFDADGIDDLAIGVPGESFTGDGNAGAVHVLYGSGDGLTRADELWHQNDEGIQGGAEQGDVFGDAVAAVDFDADGFTDLAIGIPGESVDGEDDAGAVQILYSTDSGLTTKDQLWYQGDEGLLANPGATDFFGSSLAAGDFNGDGFPDLAVGVPGEVFGSAGQAGAAHVLYSGSVGVTATDELWHQNDKGVAGAAEDDDLFGFAVFAADFSGDGAADLLAGVPGEGVSGSSGAGAVHVLEGHEGDGLTAADELWHQNDDGVAGGAEPGDMLGRSTPTAP